MGLRRLERSRPSEYRAYLDEQLRRSLSKRENDPGVGARLLIGEVASRLPTGASVLCIGCRNGLELDRFRALGHDATGIDIYSQRPDILVMDMHALDFPDGRFDAVYASHSLEHAYDLPAVLREIARVAREGAVAGVEVPVRHKGSDADRLEFGGLDDVRAALAPIVAEELYGEDIPARSETNEQGSDVARVVFRVRTRTM
jgi:SAM-dependent methyltransferase